MVTKHFLIRYHNESEIITDRCMSGMVNTLDLKPIKLLEKYITVIINYDYYYTTIN